jgi:hypothetical protein
MKRKIIKIKKEYLDVDKQLHDLRIKQNQLSKLIREILDNEPDVNKRKEIIDFVFADKIEEMHEYTLRKMYL